MQETEKMVKKLQSNIFYIIIYLKKCKTYLKLKPGIGSSSISTGHQE